MSVELLLRYAVAVNTARRRELDKQKQKDTVVYFGKGYP
jgi:hypothetical protein